MKIFLNRIHLQWRNQCSAWSMMICSFVQRRNIRSQMTMELHWPEADEIDASGANPGWARSPWTSKLPKIDRGGKIRLWKRGR
jgi:hypothetical protein